MYLLKICFIFIYLVAGVFMYVSLCVYVCVHVREHSMTCVEVREQLVGISSLFPQCSFQGLNWLRSSDLVTSTFAH